MRTRGECLLQDAPETYYLTDYYRAHPVVLVRLAGLGRDAIRDLLAMSRRLTLAKGRGHVDGAILSRRRCWSPADFRLKAEATTAAEATTVFGGRYQRRKLHGSRSYGKEQSVGPRVASAPILLT